MGCLKLIVNEDVIVDEYRNSKYATHTVDVEEGDVVVIQAEYTTFDNYGLYANINISGTGTYNEETTFNTVSVQYVVDYQLGTGSIGGWEYSTLRSHMANNILPLIPENVRSRIKTVINTHDALDKDGNKYSQTTHDKLFIPSYNDVASESGKYKVLYICPRTAPTLPG